MPSGLNLRLLNDSEPKDSGRWNWSVWVDGPPDVLDQVLQVRYALHPTFPNPIRVVTDRASQFRLESSGWGEFSIVAQLTMRDGHVETLDRWLRLEGRHEEPGDVTRRRPRVFVSASSLDQPFVKTLTTELEKQDVEVVTPTDVSPDGSISESIAGAVSSSDVVAVVMSRGWANSALHDVALGIAKQKVVVPIVLGTYASTAPPGLGNVQPVHVASEGQSARVADLLAARAKDVFFA